MSGVLVIARATLLEALRRKLILALIIVSAVVAALSAWLFHHLATSVIAGQTIDPDTLSLIASQLLIFITFSFTGVLALAAALTAAPSIGSEIESGLALAIVARPISRTAIVVGKWLGLAILLTGFTVAAGGVELVIVYVTTGYGPADAGSAVGYAASILGLTSAVGIVVMTFTLCLSTRLSAMPAGVVVIVLFFSGWLLGIGGAVGNILHNDALSTVASIGHLAFPTDGLWRGALYAMEPQSILDVAHIAPAASANPFLASTPLDPLYGVWCCVWVLGVLALTAISFQRRAI